MMGDQMIPLVECTDTGSLLLNQVIRQDGGGIPKGRMIEIYGVESGGKTSVCLLAIAEYQKIEAKKAENNPEYEERVCMFVDAEHSLDQNMAQGYGVDLSKLLYINPEVAEETFDIMTAYIDQGIIGICVIDSVAAMVPGKIESTSFEQQTMAELARLMSKASIKFTGILAKTKTTMIWINQVRSTMAMYGSWLTNWASLCREA